ncbi:MAG: hypothetical protein O7G87_00035 [bacterium]|nr:hypothetical protein [bacterium]
MPKNLDTPVERVVKKPVFQQALEKIQPAGVFEKPFPMSDLRAAIRQALAP